MTCRHSILTINLLQALRKRRSGSGWRVRQHTDAPFAERNVRFLRPKTSDRSIWRRAIRERI